MTHELKLGLIPNDPSRPRLHLADYVDPSQIVAPATSAYLNGLTFPIWLNATLGCCVAATLGLLILVWSTLLTGVPVLVSDAQILAWYRTQNPGADPAHPGVHDNGMNIQTFLGWLRGKKLPDGSTILGFADIDPRNVALVRKAIAIGGAIWTAGNITEANRAQWAAGRPFDYVAGSLLDGGHSFVVGGEDASPADDLQIGTWAKVRRASDGYLANEIGEMWFVITDKMLGSKRFVAGMDLVTFAADFTALTGDVFPAPVPEEPVSTPLGTPLGIARVGTDAGTKLITTAGGISATPAPLGCDVVVYGETTVPGYAPDGSPTSKVWRISLNGEVWLLQRNATFTPIGADVTHQVVVSVDGIPKSTLTV